MVSTQKVLVQVQGITSTRSGSNYGENRNNKRGDNNKKYKKPANPNKKKTEIACSKDGFKDGILEAD